MLNVLLIYKWFDFLLLFKVHVTKPQASRNESSEIFVVCQAYRAPDRIDPKFLDGAHLFKDVQEKNVETKSNLLALTNKKQKAEGYDDDVPVYSTLKASEFIFCENHLEKLSKCTQVCYIGIKKNWFKIYIWVEERINAGFLYYHLTLSSQKFLHQNLLLQKIFYQNWCFDKHFQRKIFTKII